MIVENMKGTLELLNNIQFLKEIKRIDGYQKYMDASFYDNALSTVLNQIVYAIDFRTMSFIHLSKNVKEVFGLEYDYVSENGPMSIYKYISAEDNELLDKHVMRNITQCALREKDHEPENLRFAYNFRMTTDSGEVRCILNRLTILIYGEHGIPLVSVGTMTDITHLHKTPELFCEGSRINKDGSVSIILHKVFPIDNGSNDFNLSKKELEVLKMVVQGFISKEIAAKTNRSIQTIHTHRKNILRKMNCHNITEAVIIAKDQKWF